MAGLIAADSDLRLAWDALPAAIFIVDRAGLILDANRAALEMVGEPEGLSERQLCGDLLRCVHASESIDCCGTTGYCRDCVIRQSIDDAADGQSTRRRMAHMFLQTAGEIRETWFLVTNSPLTLAGEALFLLTLEDVTELVQLRQLVPMCANCRKVRDDTDYWHRVEDYLYKYTALRFTHGLCPDCMRELYGDVLEPAGGPPATSDSEPAPGRPG
jgi:PAS domain S-box-containing protein